MVRLRGAVNNLGLATGPGGVASNISANGKEHKKARPCRCGAAAHQPCIGKQGAGKYSSGYIRKMKTMHRDR